MQAGMGVRLGMVSSARVRRARGRSSLLRFSAFLLAAIHAASTLLAAPAESAFWAERRAARSAPSAESAAAGPASDLGGLASHPALTPLARYVRLRLTSSSGPGPLAGRIVLHLEDVHREPEAQRLLAAALESLIATGRVAAVGLEGASGAIDYAPLRAAGSPALRREIANGLLRDGRLDAVSYVGLAAASAPVVVGVEDAALYRANVAAYRAAKAESAAAEERLRARRDAAEREAGRLPALLASFARTAADWRRGRVPLIDYLEALGSRGPVGAEIGRALEAAALERAASSTTIAAERRQFVARVAERLSPADGARLATSALALQRGSDSAAHFWSLALSLAAHAGVDLRSFPALERYTRLVRAEEAIDPERLLDEARAAEAALIKAAAPPDRRRIEELLRIADLERLSSFALTASDWERLKSRPEAGWDAHLDFYRAADRRSGAMMARLTEAAQRSEKPIVVIVAGGFHADAIRRLALAAGATYVSGSPRLTVDPASPAAMLSIFDREKTPLERLFAGRGLFLHPGPAIPPAAGSIGAEEDERPLIAGALRAARSPDGRYESAGLAFQARSPEARAEPVPAGAVIVPIDGPTIAEIRVWPKGAAEGRRDARPGEPAASPDTGTLQTRWVQRAIVWAGGDPTSPGSRFIVTPVVETAVYLGSVHGLAAVLVAAHYTASAVFFFGLVAGVASALLFAEGHQNSTRSLLAGRYAAAVLLAVAGLGPLLGGWVDFHNCALLIQTMPLVSVTSLSAAVILHGALTALGERFHPQPLAAARAARALLRRNPWIEDDRIAVVAAIERFGLYLAPHHTAALVARLLWDRAVPDDEDLSAAAALIGLEIRRRRLDPSASGWRARASASAGRRQAGGNLFLRSVHLQTVNGKPLVVIRDSLFEPGFDTARRLSAALFDAGLVSRTSDLGKLDGSLVDRLRERLASSRDEGPPRFRRREKSSSPFETLARMSRAEWESEVEWLLTHERGTAVVVHRRQSARRARWPLIVLALSLTFGGVFTLAPVVRTMIAGSAAPASAELDRLVEQIRRLKAQGDRAPALRQRLAERVRNEIVGPLLSDPTFSEEALKDLQDASDRYGAAMTKTDRAQLQTLVDVYQARVVLQKETWEPPDFAAVLRILENPEPKLRSLQDALRHALGHELERYPRSFNDPAQNASGLIYGAGRRTIVFYREGNAPFWSLKTFVDGRRVETTRWDVEALRGGLWRLDQLPSALQPSRETREAFDRFDASRSKSSNTLLTTRWARTAARRAGLDPDGFAARRVLIPIAETIVYGLLIAPGALLDPLSTGSVCLILAQALLFALHHDNAARGAAVRRFALGFTFGAIMLGAAATAPSDLVARALRMAAGASGAAFLHGVLQPPAVSAVAAVDATPVDLGLGETRLHPALGRASSGTDTFERLPFNVDRPAGQGRGEALVMDARRGELIHKGRKRLAPAAALVERPGTERAGGAPVAPAGSSQDASIRSRAASATRVGATLAREAVRWIASALSAVWRTIRRPSRRKQPPATGIDRVPGGFIPVGEGDLLKGRLEAERQMRRSA